MQLTVWITWLLALFKDSESLNSENKIELPNGISRSKHFVWGPLTSFKYYGFIIIVCCQCGMDTNKPDNIKLLMCNTFRIFPVNNEA